MERKLKRNNKLFFEEMRKVDPHFFDRMVQGQEPELFVLACSDSRVSPSVITQMPLGKLFIHRNIGNQVNEHDESFSASLYYALKHLKVKGILIIGHTHCGGIDAAVNGNNEEALKPWLKGIRESFINENSTQMCTGQLSETHLLKQVERLNGHPIYKEFGQHIPIIPVVYHIENGEIEFIKYQERTVNAKDM
ncbi:carbonic anhydrase [Alkalihalobacterium chitinilyticum]|uniref:carbonic anhydrase n=1 Tax=Alkalihalobacterium chitinilyticum TaxID=2980103 RepID=A0ABT5VDM6_9BACI|nr:carbonic anhydrase [Alkalihalobacterium chitinilyticum]MDE5413561.1 carbonic anhydrase [Alkalihalobacterium chitinilyticum]